LRAASNLARPRFQQQTVKKNFAPAIAQRFASTNSAKDGKIHQVIGAVVDGTC
jgi:F-type H+-transporting ATPase subunit beta